MQLTSPGVPTQGALVPPPVRLGLSRIEFGPIHRCQRQPFDQMVADGRMPKPKLINSRKVWHRLRLDEAFAELPEEGQATKSVEDEWAT